MLITFTLPFQIYLRYLRDKIKTLKLTTEMVESFTKQIMRVLPDVCSVYVSVQIC